MLQVTLHAVDDFFRTWDKIKAGKISEYSLGILFKRLSKLEYRTEHEKKVDYYVKLFLSGPDHIDIHCNAFLKEHFKKVQAVFWKKYKYFYQKTLISEIKFEDDDENSFSFLNAIDPKIILKTCKEIKT